MRRGDRRGRGLLACALAGVVLGMAGCADFSVEPPSATVQPSLSPAEMHPQGDDPLATSVATPTSVEGSPQSSPGSTSAEDPCRPTDPAIVAACLTTPWGLAVLPDGVSAVVGERTTGRILQVAPRTEPFLIAQVDDVDATGDGGLLGIALSPHFAEDGLLYAYVTTKTDNRIVRIAPGDVPKAVFTGIPRGAAHNGGRIEFGADGYLYVATGDAGVDGAGSDPGTLAGKVLRIDEFGRPAPADGSTASPETSAAPTSDTVPPDTAPGTAPTDPLTAVYAGGLVAPTGICVITAGIAVIDRVGPADELVVVMPGADLSTAAPLWSFGVSDGGAVDCAQTETVLGVTSLDQQLVTALSLAPTGGFTGQPQQLAKGTYGRLLTLEAGPQGLFWATTSNKDGHGDPQPRDDMVVIIPDGGGAGGDDGKD